ncbi:TIGR00730 family Rossman fold protein [Leptolyngbya sp. FACHB-671]|uniref:LOG family protein n=1 Tax=Leptolyngbya sp. FACHB-671 TaxID=2692812 RepID=UPI0016847424|nr:TIGR00730 family Rossman fold protein [Leptolyngbya sp. FACHB-671]MBD2068709.1 TIGR00730 family Rossman fold protein [Leptolyngbya sp. FACHB-671]
MKRVCVFCGSNQGANPAYGFAAEQLGKLLAQQNIGLVYGGGKVGLMGTVADAALAAGGEVIGVIPQALADREIAHTGLSKLHIVASMHKRKALMSDYADAFIALPGGMGTLEEFAEVLTWGQLGLHQKPCGLLNIEGYYNSLIAFFNQAVQAQFVRPEHRSAVIEAQTCEELLEKLNQYQPIQIHKWIDRDQT